MNSANDEVFGLPSDAVMRGFVIGNDEDHYFVFCKGTDVFWSPRPLMACLFELREDAINVGNFLVLTTREDLHVLRFYETADQLIVAPDDDSFFS